MYMFESFQAHDKSTYKVAVSMNEFNSEKIS